MKTEVTSNGLVERASHLLNSCANEDDWEPGSDSIPFIAFLTAARQNERFRAAWDWETAVDIVRALLDSFQSRIDPEELPVSHEIGKQFVDIFLNSMALNIADHWLVLPLHNTELSEPIEFGDYFLIPAHLERQEKIRLLSEKSGIQLNELEFLANHTEQSRSPSFYGYTLCCHRVTHYTPWLMQFGWQIARGSVSLLRVLMYAGQFKDDRTVSFHAADQVPNSHILVLAKEYGRCGHIPIWAGEEATMLPTKLDWLKDKSKQQNFVDLESNIGFGNGVDRLAFRIRRALHYFNRAVNIRYDPEHDQLDGLGLEILFLMIAAESLLLGHEGEKRIRLATLLSHLVQLDGIPIEEIYDSIQACYEWRSDFVHSGEDTFPEYDEDFKEGEPQKKLRILRWAVAELISNAPYYLNLAKGRAKDIDSKKARETAWFTYLEEIWSSILVSKWNQPKSSDSTADEPTT